MRENELLSSKVQKIFRLWDEPPLSTGFESSPITIKYLREIIYTLSIDISSYYETHTQNICMNF